jgi:hypothetical protein
MSTLNLAFQNENNILQTLLKQDGNYLMFSIFFKQRNSQV